MVVGVLLALMVVVAMVTAAVWLVRTKALLGRKSPGGVAFENPSYLREVNMDHIQVNHVLKPYYLFKITTKIGSYYCDWLVFDV